MEYLNSKHIERAVAELAKLPGIGKRTALRLALHLLRQEETEVESLGQSLITMKKEIRFCKRCHNMADGELCSICGSPKRNNGQICVVQDITDVIAIEKTGEFFGLYHVLGGVISPMDGIGPSELQIDSLLQRMETEKPQEIILALPTTVEGDTTNFYLFKKLASYDTKITIIARGVGIGDELEYIDELTLGRSLINRQPYESSIGKG